MHNGAQIVGLRRISGVTARNVRDSDAQKNQNEEGKDDQHG